MTAPVIDADSLVDTDWAPACQMMAGHSDDDVYWKCDNTADYYAEVHCAPCWRPKLICKDCLYGIALHEHTCEKCGRLTRSSDRIRNVKTL